MKRLGRLALAAGLAGALLTTAWLARVPAHAGFTGRVTAQSAAPSTSLWFSCSAAVSDLASSAVVWWPLADADGGSAAQDVGGGGSAGVYYASGAATTTHAGGLGGTGACARERSVGFRANGSTFAGSADLSASLPTTNLTVAAWIRTGGDWTAGGDVASLCSAQKTATCSQRDDRLYLSADGRIVFAAAASTGGSVRALMSGTVVADGSWHHVAGTISAAGMKLWVDGVDVTASATASSSAYASLTATRTPAAYFHVGGADSGTNWTYASSTYFVGTIAQAAFFKTALTARQIGSLAASGR